MDNIDLVWGGVMGVCAGIGVFVIHRIFKKVTQ